MKNFKIGQKIWFYYDSVISCQKGQIEEMHDDYMKIAWLNEDGFCTGHSKVINQSIFSTKNECIAYKKSIREMRKKQLQDRLNSKESILQILYDGLNESFECDKNVFAEQIEKHFQIKIVR